MPSIRGLASFLREVGVVRTGPLSLLENATVAFDGVQWVRNTPCVLGEPFHVAMGGPFLAVDAHVRALLAPLLARSVDPVVVFGGLIPPRPPQMAGAGSGADKQQQQTKYEEAWAAYEQGNLRTAAYLFRQLGGYVSLDLEAALMEALDALDVRCVRAAYGAPAQLSWLSQQGFAHAAMGGLELLLYGAELVILSLDASAETMEFVRLSETLRVLELSHDQFVDMCLMAGYGRCRTFVPVCDVKGRFVFRRAHELVREHGSAVAAISAQAGTMKKGTRNSYRNMLLRSKHAVLRHPVLVGGGECAPLFAQPGPQRHVHDQDVFGCALGRVAHRLLAKGVVSPQVLNNVVSGVLVDVAPAVPSEAYTAFLDRLTALRVATFRALFHVVGGARSITNKRWYADNDIVLIREEEEKKMTETEGEAGRLPPPPPEDVRFVVRPGHDACGTALRACAHQFADSNFWSSSSQQSILADELEPLSGDDNAHEEDWGEVGVPEVERRVALRFVAQVGLVSAAFAPTALGEFLVAHMEDERHHRVGGGAAAEGECTALLMLAQLLQAGQLADERRPVHLIAQTCSLLAPTLRRDGSAWSGPIDRELCAFGAITKALNRSLRNLFEALLLVEAGDNNLRVDDGDEGLVALRERLPFACESGIVMGVMVKEFFEREGDAEALAARLPQCADVRRDLQRALRFWATAVKLVESDLFSDDVALAFREAEAFLSAPPNAQKVQQLQK